MNREPDDSVQFDKKKPFDIEEHEESECIGCTGVFYDLCLNGDQYAPAVRADEEVDQ